MKNTLNKNLIISVLFIVAIIFGFMWYNQRQELTALKYSSVSTPNVNLSLTPTPASTVENPKKAQEELTIEDWNSDPYSWQKLKCVPSSKIFCDRTSCEQDNPTVWLELDRRAKTFSRCDTKGCDTHKGDFESAGAFTNIQEQSPTGVIIKVLGDRKYIEIATLNLGSFISSGVCTQIQ